MYSPVACHISSANPLIIHKIFGDDPSHPGRVSGSTEMSSPALGHSHLADVVFASDDWQVYEDELLIAKGQGRKGEVLIAVDSIKTGYLQTFAKLLLTAAPGG